MPAAPLLRLLRQHLLQVLMLDNRFHRRPNQDRPAFDVGSRRARSVSSAAALRLHRLPGAQVQLDLNLLPHRCARDRRSIRPFHRSGLRRTLPPTMPSADFCATVRPPCGSSVRSGTRRRPPGKSDRLRRHAPGLPPRPLMTVDFAIICSLVRPGTPRYPVLVHRAAACSTLLSDAASRRRPCASLTLRRHQAG